MVSQFPLDPMHLVDLGIVKRIVTYIYEGLSKLAQESLSESYSKLADFTPYEFTRKPRDFKELPRWKATEFRFFILYSGIFVLKNILKADQFYHFLLLSTALRLFSKKESSILHLDNAQAMINEFVTLFPQFYVLKHVNYNVHSLLHLPQYIKMYGPIDSFSGYKFENYMQELKKSIKNPNHILQQIHNRLLERQILNDKLLSSGITKSCENKNSNKTNSFTYNKHFFKGNQRDCFCLVSDRDQQLIYFQIKLISYENGKTVILGNRYLENTSWFDNPVDSKTTLGIVVISCLSPSIESFPTELIIDKFCSFPINKSKNEYVLVPMLHENLKINY